MNPNALEPMFRKRSNSFVTIQEINDIIDSQLAQVRHRNKACQLFFAGETLPSFMGILFCSITFPHQRVHFKPMDVPPLISSIVLCLQRKTTKKNHYCSIHPPSILCLIIV